MVSGLDFYQAVAAKIQEAARHDGLKINLITHPTPIIFVVDSLLAVGKSEAAQNFVTDYLINIYSFDGIDLTPYK
ncbi:hypothetical protein LC612_38730 [Nostoc sp. CHAB 5834]|nr:hypothetical protein [Nostoc sp. CHAB 5834]